MKKMFIIFYYDCFTTCLINTYYLASDIEHAFYYRFNIACFVNFLEDILLFF